MRRLRLACVSSLFVAALLAARLAAAEPITRSVYVTVVDDKGQPVTGLTAADFGIKEAGKDRDIASVEPAKAKMHLAMLVEETLTPQGGVRSGIADFIKRMTPSAEIALIVVGQRNSTSVDYTSDPNALITGINNFSMNQQQNLQTMVPEGVYEVAKAFEKDKPARPVIVLIALEKQQISTEQPQNVLNQLARSLAQMSVVSMESGDGGTTDVRTMNDMAGRAQVMGDGPKQSGGRHIEVSALTGMPKALQQVADDLSSQYLITYTLPDGVKPSDRLSVTLKKKGGVLRAPSKVSDK